MYLPASCLDAGEYVNLLFLVVRHPGSYTISIIIPLPLDVFVWEVCGGGGGNYFKTDFAAMRYE